MVDISIREQIDKTKLSYLIDTYDEPAFLADTDSLPRNAKTYYNKLVKYLGEKFKADTDYVKYRYAKGRIDGRVFSPDGIQQVLKNVRNFLAPTNAQEIDIISAHPQILHNICLHHKINCSCLADYINNRQTILDAISIEDSITKEEAKKKVLIATNSNTRIATQNKWLKSYIGEVKKIRTELQSVSDYDYLKEIANKENFDGSFINHILCVYENSILQVIKDFYEGLGCETWALMFDGIILYPTDVPIEECFEELEKLISTKIPIMKVVKFKVKELLTNIQMPLSYSVKLRDDYETVKAKFELTNCKVDCVFYNNANQYSKSEFITKYENCYFYDNNKAKKFINFWLFDEKLRHFDNVGMYPKSNAYMCPPTTYNLWIDWNINTATIKEDEDIDELGLEFFINHIKLLCNFDELLTAFVIRWLAQFLQYTHIKTIELIFISSEGAGKGLFLEFLRTIMGSKKVFESTDPQRDIFGQFNTLLKDSVLVVFNEANRSNFFNQNDKKKALITDEVLTINDKGKSSYQIHSNHRFITFTNNPDPSMKNKRRDLFIRCSDSKIGDKQYFMEGFKYAKSLKTAKKIYDYLINLEGVSPTIGEFDIPTNSIYDTIIKEEQRSIVLQYLENYCLSYPNQECCIGSNDLYTLFLEFLKDRHIKFEMTKPAFSMKITFYDLKHIVKCGEGKSKWYINNTADLLKELKVKN
jgi:hypothetical protein